MAAGNLEFITATRYYFNADGITDKLIQKIDSANVETPATNIQSSGKGAILQSQLSPTAAKMGSIKLTLGLTKDKDIYDWYDKCNKNNNEPNQWKSNRKNATISAYDQTGAAVVEWTFTNCYPTSYTLPSFTAGGNDIALEVIDIVYEGLLRKK